MFKSTKITSFSPRQFTSINTSINTSIKYALRQIHHTLKYSKQDIDNLLNIESGGSRVLRQWMEKEHTHSDYTIQELKQHQKESADKELLDIETQGRIGYIINTIE